MQDTVNINSIMGSTAEGHGAVSAFNNDTSHKYFQLSW
jgi:hypothetical protein